MPLPVPKYVQLSALQDANIRFTWDDWNVEASDLPVDDQLKERLQSISHRAIVAFTIGTAEWILYRFGRLCMDPAPRQYLEAAWAQVVDFGYSTHRDIKKDEWTGPIRGPIGIALRRVIFAVQQAEACANPGWRAGRASELAIHVMADPTAYKHWREHIMARLLKLYPLNPEEKLGEVVPWQALEPEYDFKLDQTESLINHFLASLDWKTNPFLNSPEKMLQQGFQGTPYVFDIKKDRQSRFEW